MLANCAAFGELLATRRGGWSKTARVASLKRHALRRDLPTARPPAPSWHYLNHLAYGDRSSRNASQNVAGDEEEFLISSAL